MSFYMLPTIIHAISDLIWKILTSEVISSHFLTTLYLFISEKMTFQSTNDITHWFPQQYQWSLITFAFCKHMHNIGCVWLKIRCERERERERDVGPAGVVFYKDKKGISIIGKNMLKCYSLFIKIIKASMCCQNKFFLE